MLGFGVKTGNLLIVIFIIVIFFTLFSMEPFHTGHILMPTPIDLELAIVIMVISISIILYILLRRKITIYPL